MMAIVYICVHQLIFNIPQPLAFIVKLFNDIMISLFLSYVISTTFITKVSKSAKIGNRYNQVPHLTQDTDGK